MHFVKCKKRDQFLRHCKMEKEKKVKEYMEGMRWVYKYYIGECKDWGWKYESEYVVLLSEVVLGLGLVLGLEKELKEMNVKKQLEYVMGKEKSKFEWTYSRYFWEGHVVLEE